MKIKDTFSCGENKDLPGAQVKGRGWIDAMGRVHPDIELLGQQAVEANRKHEIQSKLKPTRFAGAEL